MVELALSGLVDRSRGKAFVVIPFACKDMHIPVGTVLSVCYKPRRESAKLTILLLAQSVIQGRKKQGQFRSERLLVDDDRHRQHLRLRPGKRHLQS